MLCGGGIPIHVSGLMLWGSGAYLAGSVLTYGASLLSTKEPNPMAKLVEMIAMDSAKGWEV